MKRIAATSTSTSASSKLTSRIRSGASSTIDNDEQDDNNKKASLVNLTDDDEDSEDSYSKQYRKHNKSKSSSSSFLNLYWGNFKYHWSLLSSTSKIAAMFVVIYFWQHVLLGIWDQKFHQIGLGRAGGRTIATSSGSIEKSFAVVINTYKRPDRLREAVLHYANTCGKRAHISQVFVIWCEQGVEIPKPTSFFDDIDAKNVLRTSTYNLQLQNRAEVHVLPKANSLNSRFEPIDLLTTTCVFMVDDDVRVSCPSLGHGFEAWQTNSDAMIGYYPRLASKPLYPSRHSDKNDLIYHTWPIVYYRHSFNFVLTKASFLHSKYLELYTNHYPQAIKTHIDQHMNCEDIAMSMLVANYTKSQRQQQALASQPLSPVLYVEGSIIDHGIFGGISTGSGHMTTRSECLSKLTSIFLENNWDSPLGDDEQYPLGENSWIQHAPGFWWQYLPSNTFEWFAFANTFT